MKREEAIAILTILKTSYPNHYKNLSKQEAEGTINLYQTIFEENVVVVNEAVKSVICKSEFPPTIAAIKKQIALITKPQIEELSEGEAWANVRKAISNSNYNSFEEFNKLDEVSQKIIGSPNQLREWANVDTDQLQTVIQSNFMRSYRAKSKSISEYNSLPESAKELNRQLLRAFENKLLVE